IPLLEARRVVQRCPSDRSRNSPKHSQPRGKLQFEGRDLDLARTAYLKGCSRGRRSGHWEAISACSRAACEGLVKAAANLSAEMWSESGGTHGRKRAICFHMLPLVD